MLREVSDSLENPGSDPTTFVVEAKRTCKERSVGIPTHGWSASVAARGQDVRSNIQAGISSQRVAANPFNVQRKTRPGAFSTTE
ncbi:MAG: hypothetical protein ACT6Q8_25150 [Niveispirillum sp.]|uniref:hypothetical protein n=1 Tax=Niveispirillum sp. TaxID=1917217 RepID=UPI004035FEA1